MLEDWLGDIVNSSPARTYFLIFNFYVSRLDTDVLINNMLFCAITTLLQEFYYRLCSLNEGIFLRWEGDRYLQLHCRTCGACVEVVPLLFLSF